MNVKKKIRFSKFEQAIIKAMEALPSKSWTIEEIADRAYEERAEEKRQAAIEAGIRVGKRKKEVERPVHWRSSVAATMRILAIKTAHMPASVCRVSDLGSGNTAEYKLIPRGGKKGTFLSSLLAG